MLSDHNKQIKKIGEEQAEFLQALLLGSDTEVVSEAADLLYHMMVAIRGRGIDFALVLTELHKREPPSDPNNLSLWDKGRIPYVDPLPKVVVPSTIRMDLERMEERRKRVEERSAKFSQKEKGRC